MIRKPVTLETFGFENIRIGLVVRCLSNPDPKRWRRIIAGGLSSHPTVTTLMVGTQYKVRGRVAITQPALIVPYRNGVLLEGIKNGEVYAGNIPVGEFYYPLECFIRVV